MQPWTSTPTSRVIGESGLSATPDGWKLDIRLPWYRSLPLSTVEVGELSVDGVSIDLNRVLFELEGRRMPLRTLAEEYRTVWYVLDSAYLHFQAPGNAGGSHEISVTMNLYPPYIRGLKRMTRDSRRLTPQPSRAA